MHPKSDISMRNAYAHFIRTAPGVDNTPVDTVNGILSLVEDKIFIRQVRTTTRSHGQKNARAESNICSSKEEVSIFKSICLILDLSQQR